MRRQVITVSSATISPTIPVDPQANYFAIGIGCVVTGAATYKVQHTFDDIFDSKITPVWFDHSVLTGMVANKDGNYAFPIAAVRLNVTAYTSGSVIMTLLQSP